MPKLRRSARLHNNSHPSEARPPFSPFDDLPIDIISHISLHIPQSSLAAFARTSKLCSEAAFPILYREIHITSNHAMSLLIGPSFLRRPVFTQTKRITLDLPADKAFGEMMGNWRINPDEEEWTAGPLFERAVGVSFGVAWTRSMYSESKATLSNSARNLARLADPTTICFRYATELSPTPTVGSRPNRLTSILKELWPRLSSVNYHGRLDELTFPHVSDPDHLYIAHVFYVQGDEPWFKTIDEFLRARLVGGSAAVDPIMPDAIRTLYTLSARGFRAASGGDGTKRLSFHTAEPEAKTAAETTAVAKPEKDVGEVSGASSKEGKEISRISACAACGVY